PNASLLLSRLTSSGCFLLYAPPFTPSYGKGKLVTLSNVGTFFSVTAGSRTANNGALVGGKDGELVGPWITRLSSNLDVTTTTHLPLTSASAMPVAANLRGIVEDSSGRVFACGDAVRVRASGGVESYGFVSVGSTSLSGFKQ